MAYADALLRRPSIAAARTFLDAVEGYADWPRPPEGAWDRFRRDTEASLFTGALPLADS